jgi:transposase
LELVRNSGKSKAAVERDLGLYAGQIRHWEQRHQKDEGMNSPKKPSAQEPDWKAEAKRLQKENEILRQECEILKKAIAIFTPK